MQRNLPLIHGIFTLLIGTSCVFLVLLYGAMIFSILNDRGIGAYEHELYKLNQTEFIILRAWIPLIAFIFMITLGLGYYSGNKRILERLFLAFAVFFIAIIFQEITLHSFRTGKG